MNECYAVMGLGWLKLEIVRSELTRDVTARDLPEFTRPREGLVSLCLEPLRDACCLTFVCHQLKSSVHRLYKLGSLSRNA
jgi:hypothetical protein